MRTSSSGTRAEWKSSAAGKERNRKAVAHPKYKRQEWDAALARKIIMGFSQQGVKRQDNTLYQCYAMLALHCP